MLQSLSRTWRRGETVSPSTGARCFLTCHPAQVLGASLHPPPGTFSLSLELRADPWGRLWLESASSPSWCVSQLLCRQTLHPCYCLRQGYCRMAHRPKVALHLQLLTVRPLLPALCYLHLPPFRSIPLFHLSSSICFLVPAWLNEGHAF